MAAAAGLGSRRGRSRQPGSRRWRGQLQEPVVLDILDAWRPPPPAGRRRLPAPPGPGGRGVTVSEQTGIRCVLMRGGTSKGWYFTKPTCPGQDGSGTRPCCGCRDRDELGRHDRRQDGPLAAHRPGGGRDHARDWRGSSRHAVRRRQRLRMGARRGTRPHRQRARRGDRPGRRPDRDGAGDPGQGRRPDGAGDRLVTGRRAVARPADGRARRPASGVPDPVRGRRSRRGRWICGSGWCS